ncbi:MAG TPA: hypothetical protein VFW65_35820 [Pseudonocardiaceae bacterium]|nr:hypothetical protein [Pseudonocardiaceae bacterium]
MRVQILVDGIHRDDQAHELIAWLRREDRLRGRVQLSPTTIGPGQMGSVTDTIAIAMGTGGAGTVVARALVAWVSHRTTDVKLTLTRPEGTELSIDAHRVHDPQALLASIADFLDAPPVERDSDETA